jgi:hypothetical protein
LNFVRRILFMEFIEIRTKHDVSASAFVKIEGK